uniref:Sushi, von Willebrand factor type A, EGF and pentraxin domain-containing protein 1 n=1 Tax=Ciona savignyi TaxID=51511 RepID=H2Y5C5_CIOSA
CRRPGSVYYGSYRPYRSWYTAGSTVRYTCRSGYTLSGRANLTCSSNGTWSYRRPSCVAVRCSRPDSVRYASFRPYSRSYAVSATVTYTCRSGYSLSGQSVLTCGADGEWSHDEPTCARVVVKCPAIGAPDNGSIRPTISQQANVGTRVLFTCNDGFRRNGSRDSRCQSNGRWSSSVPTCEPIQCAAPGNVDNGSFEPGTGPYGVSNTVTYTCSDNYVLEGQVVLTCLVSGEWSHDEPTCNPITCNRPDEIAFGSLTTAGDNFEIGETVTYICNDGHEIVGQDVLTCTNTGEWSHDEPTCTRIIQCATPDEPLNGGFSPNQPAYDITEVVTFTCANGFILNGQSQITCQDTGLWSDDEPTCDGKIIQCATPDEPLNGGFSPNQPAYDITDVVTFTCADGFILNGQSQITCQDTGLWSDDEPICDAITCNRPDEIAFGSLTTAGERFEIDETVTYICNDGYEIVGQNVLTCTVTGEWSHDEPTCTRIIQCATPDEPLNGGFSPNQPAYDITEVVTFTCANGFILNGQSQITCEDTGLWSDDEPTCDVVTCPIPVEPINGGVTPVQEQYPVNFVIWYTCDTGYTTADRKDAICRPDGTWSDDAPNCVAITCNRPDEISYGSLTTAGNSFEIGETVTYVCNDGYEIVGQGVLTCTNTGEWSHDEPTCQRVIVPQTGPSCAGRCGRYDVNAACDCDYICSYYGTCCSDYRSLCKYIN